MTVTRVSENEFRLECEDDKEAETMPSLKKFMFEGQIYTVSKITPGPEAFGYHLFFAYVDNPPKDS